ncbi:MAG TPA: mechanosensitive ion channel family protein, partial [Vicinamibacterales bacterium]|nr:mechanosensitive ion channel family protein [Vicinamibacterales bacterium]
APSLHDALVIAGATAGVYVILVAVAQGLRRWWSVTFGVTFHLLAVAGGLLVGVEVSVWRTPLAEALQRHLTAAVLLLAAFPVITVLNRLLWKRSRRGGPGGDTPRVLADATSILVMLVASLVVLQYVYGVKVPGLLAGSGLVAIILGLALQSLLSNLLAGIALHFERPFTTGDWLLVDGMHGRVVEVSWRSTRLVTADDVLIDVPNSTIVTSTITNFATPTPKHAVHATIGLHYDVPPARAQKVLRDAATSVAGVCRDPAPVVYVKAFDDSAVTYEIKVWIDDHAIFNRVLSDLRSHCWYAVRRAGMEIPFPIVTVYRPKPDRTAELARAAAGGALRGHPIFGFLTPEQGERLLRESPVVLFAATEHVIEQGAAGDSMFLLVRGRVAVQMTRDGRTAVVAELGSGECFGEMSVLTGEPRSATVVALDDEVEVVEIPKAAFAGLLHDNPDVVGRLSELLAQRQLANEQRPGASSDAGRAEQTRAGMLRRVRAFFQLGM